MPHPGRGRGASLSGAHYLCIQPWLLDVPSLRSRSPDVCLAVVFGRKEKRRIAVIFISCVQQCINE